MGISRRRIFKYCLAAIPVAGVGAYAYARGPGRTGIVVREKDVRIPGLLPGLNGLRIAHLSDFHIDPLMEHEFQAKAVRVANSLKPDLITLTGDYVSDRGEAADELGPILGQLEAKHGVVACLGNHDAWHSPSRVSGSLERSGVRVLVNDGLSLRSGGVPLFVGGVDSCWGGQPDTAKTFSSRKSDEMALLLCHEPDLFPKYTASDSPVSLMLSGHTHGGQVRCPGIGAPVLPSFGKRYPYGIYQNGDARLHVNPGIGTVDMHLRFWCRPEISVLTLRNAG